MVETNSVNVRIMSRSKRISGRDIIVALVCGVLVAQCGTMVLHRSYLWAGLITAAMVVAVFSLTARNFREHWLMIFALTLPLEIKKMLIDSDIVREMAQVYGIPIGELPGPVVYLSDFPFIILMGLWVFDIMLKKKKVFFPKSNKYAVAFLVWAGLSLANASVFTYGFFDLLRTFKFYLLYLYIANNVTSVSMLKTLVKYLLVGMIIQGLLCLYQYISQDISHLFGNLFGKQDLYSAESMDKFKEFFATAPGIDRKRASGTVGPINAQAQYFEFLLPIAFLLSLRSVSIRRNILSWLALVVGGLGLLVTFSRGGFVGIMTGIVVVFLFARRKQMISRQKYIAVILIVLLMAIMVAPTVFGFMMSRHKATLARFHLYKVGADMIRAHPLLGVGLNNHTVMAPYYDPDTYIFPMPVHNHYLFVASEVGIPGLVFFLAFLCSATLMALRNAGSSLVYPAVISLGIVGAFAAIGTHNLVDHLSYHTNLTLVWLLAGLAAAVSRIKADESNRIEGPAL